MPTTRIPRPEHPRPQFTRSDWLCLNGTWQFEIDQGDSGLDRGLVNRPLKQRITVPFCPESKLSGIGNTDYLNAVWYRREVRIPKAWRGRRILLHFQASDYDTFVWADGVEVGRHRGGNHNGYDYPATFLTQWLEALNRDYNHPSIIGWCPLNESLRRHDERITTHDDVMRGLFLATKAADSTRPVLDVSGYSHTVDESDVYDSHDYDQNPATFKARHDGLLRDAPYVRDELLLNNTAWRGQPYFVSEFGGIRWNPRAKPGDASWGYGDAPQTLEEFYTRFEGLCAALLDNPRMFGYCYTQLTDVFQEQNGIYFFDRKKKYDLARVRAAQIRPAAIEQT